MVCRVHDKPIFNSWKIPGGGDSSLGLRLVFSYHFGFGWYRFGLCHVLVIGFILVLIFVFILFCAWDLSQSLSGTVMVLVSLDKWDPDKDKTGSSRIQRGSRQSGLGQYLVQTVQKGSRQCVDRVQTVKPHSDTVQILWTWSRQGQYTVQPWFPLLCLPLFCIVFYQGYVY